MRHRKSCRFSASVGALKEAMSSPCGSISPAASRTMPPLPLVSMPCRTSSTRRSSPSMPRAKSISCRSASSTPTSNSASLAASLSSEDVPGHSGVALVSIALRSTGPGGRRNASMNPIASPCHADTIDVSEPQE